MNEINDYLGILGLDRSATLDDIKLAYRKLAKKSHPDVKKDKAESERCDDFLNIQRVYEYLVQNINKIPIQKKKSDHDFIPRDFIRHDYTSFFQEFENLFRIFENDLSYTSIDHPEPFVDLKRIIKERDKKNRYWF